jgi:signal transduction histidine kinase
MEGLMRSLDWSQTPLGPAVEWPQSLRTVVNILLTSRYQMWMAWGSEFTCLYNDAYRPTLGIKHPWALGKPARDVWAEIWRDIGPRIEKVIATGQATYEEGLLLILERSGFPEETYHTFSYSPLADDTGKIAGMLCVVTEETERVIGERRMALLRELASELASSSIESEVIEALRNRVEAYGRDLPFTLTYLFDTDGSGKARLACATGIDAGHPAAPAVIPSGPRGVWRADKMFDGATPIIVSDLNERLAQPLPPGAWERAPSQAVIVPIKQQGQERPAGFIVAAINPYRRYDAAYAGFIALLAVQLASALANARAYEEERRRAEALAEIDRAKTAFFSNVSHEFRTPLTLMLGPLEDILAKPPEEPLRDCHELLSVVHRNGLRLQRLVNALLDFSRIEAGRVQASYEPTDLAMFTAELASNFRSTMERAGLRFSIECPPLSQPVYVDHEMWEKVILNLLANAFKYTIEGSVTVRLAERDGCAALQVIDTGVGIPEDELPRLFERFHRVESTRGRTNEGTGIGLALVQELVNLHGGSVAVTSSVGQGSTFTVSIPYGIAHLPQDRVGAARSQSSTASHADTYVEEALRWLPENPVRPEAVPDSRADPHRGSQFRSHVLLADDNADMRDYVRRLLESRYEVTSVSNGEEAVAAALAKRPDLVLADVMMPVLDGFGLLKALRGHEQTKTVPIILLSARAGEESRVEGLDAGADDYLVKPFTARELLARVEAHLSLARMRTQADQARRSSEMRLGLALDATGMLAWEWDPVNDVFLSGDFFPFVGASLQNAEQGVALIHPEDRARHRANVERVVREGGSWFSEFRLRRADTGETAWLEERATGIPDETGRVTRVIGVLSDITRRKAAEEEMRRRNQELERANSELEEFTYVASHDLQEPLRTVNVYTQLLLNRLGLQPLNAMRAAAQGSADRSQVPAGDVLRAASAEQDQQAHEFATFISDAVHRMEQLIRDLLAYARVVHREQEEAGRADLNRSVEETLRSLNALVQETDAVITRDELPVVLGDERQLSQVFQNLLSNCLKYSKEDSRPQVHIAAQRTNGEWLISIADKGIGFEPQYAERIFGLFKRLHKDNYPGTGLGLAICRRIVERYGGRIWATSEGDGRGATVYFTLRTVPNE